MKQLLWNPQTDYNLQNAWHHQYRKSWSRPQNEQHSRIFHTITWKIFDYNIKSKIHFRKEFIFYLCSKFHPIGACLMLLFDCPNLLPTFGPTTTFTPGFYTLPMCWLLSKTPLSKKRFTQWKEICLGKNLKELHERTILSVIFIFRKEFDTVEFSIQFLKTELSKL